MPLLWVSTFYRSSLSPGLTTFLSANLGRAEAGSFEASAAVCSLLSNVDVSRVCASIVADMGEEFVAMSTEDRAMPGESVLGGAAGVASLVEAAAMASACVSIADDREGIRRPWRQGRTAQCMGTPCLVRWQPCPARGQPW